MTANFDVVVYLVTPQTIAAFGGSGMLISAYVSQETSATLTSAIESGDGVNEFVVPDISIKGRDRSNTVQPYLKLITPTSMDFSIFIKQNYLGQGENFIKVYPILTILPNTLVFDEIEKTFAFTAVHPGRNAALTDASTLFKTRPTMYGNVSRWQLSGASTQHLNVVTIFDQAGYHRADLYAGDRIHIGDESSGSGDEFTIKQVAYVALDTYTVTLDKAPNTVYASGTYVSLMTPYDRNLTLSSMVTTLFAAVPHTNALKPGGFMASALPGQTTLYSSPLTLAGLTGQILGVVPYIDPANPGTFGRSVLMVTTTGIYKLEGSVEGPWTLYIPLASTATVRDPTNYRTVLGVQGARRRIDPVTAKYGLYALMTYYGYWMKVQPGDKFYRYLLEISCNADVPVGEPVPFTVSLYQEEASTVFPQVWGNKTLISVLETGSSADDLSQLYNSFGIDVDPESGVAVFSDVTQTGTTSDPATFQTSVYVPGVGVTRNKVTGRALPVLTSPYHFALFFDGELGQSPKINTYAVNGAGGFSLLSQNAQNVAGMIPTTVRWNAGDGKYYGLYVNPDGLYLRTFNDEQFNRTATTPADVWVTEQGSEVLYGFAEADLMVWRKPGTSGRYPMVALNGNVPFFVDNSFSGAVDYADMTDLKVGDALQQLSILVGAYVYYDPYAYGYFRSRSTPSGTWIGGTQALSRLDDGGALTIRAQSIWAKTTLYVRIEKEGDETVYGEAGNKSYRDDEALGLTLSCRFIPTKAYADAVASGLLAYLGAQKRWVEIQYRLDSRAYWLGNEFTATIDGAVRTFQIVEIQHPIFGKSAKIVGVEL